jgi:hypothetical protein
VQPTSTTEIKNGPHAGHERPIALRLIGNSLLKDCLDQISVFVSLDDFPRGEKPPL